MDTAHKDPNAGKQELNQQAIDRPDPIVKADHVAYVLFERPELDRQQQFLEDFGMQVAASNDQAVYLRGHGTSPWFYAAYLGKKARFLGAGYAVETREELEAFATASKQTIEPCDGPGGGERVRLTDPDGFIVDVVHGRQLADRIDARLQPFEFNSPLSKPRLNSPIRTQPAPTPLEKLGHMVLAVSNFERSSQWYMRHLGVIPTDVQYVDDGTPALAFCRLDRGDQPADHHTVVFLQHIAPALMHTAYEAMDVDSIGQGAQHLKAQGWRHHWGIGRHVLGSQIFDYWIDPYGDEIEHYADGDVFTADHPTAFHPLNRGSLWSWGDDLPPMEKPSPLMILKLVLTGKMKSMPPVMKRIMKAMKLKPRSWLS